MTMRRSGPHGYTLVEVLVVIAIMLALGSMMVAINIKSGERRAALEGAERLSGWLLLAKQWALRDQAPRGLRLIVDSNPFTPDGPNPTFGMVVQLQYIDQPDAWVYRTPTGQATYLHYDPDDAPRQNIVWSEGGGADFSGGFPGTFLAPSFQNRAATWPIAPGDILEMDQGRSKQTGVIDAPLANPQAPNYPTALSGVYFNGSSGQNRYELRLAGPLGQLPRNKFADSNWRIIRQPRPRPGEALLNMPRDVAIDVRCNNIQHPADATLRAYPAEPMSMFGPNPAPPGTPSLPTGPLDILFTPYGAVFQGATPYGTDLKLWVRDVSSPPPQPGNPYLYGGDFFIVTVSLRTSLISVHPADRTLDTNVTPNIYQQPYSFTQDGRSSGL